MSQVSVTLLSSMWSLAVLKSAAHCMETMEMKSHVLCALVDTYHNCNSTITFHYCNKNTCIVMANIVWVTSEFVCSIELST